MVTNYDVDFHVILQGRANEKKDVVWSEKAEEIYAVHAVLFILAKNDSSYPSHAICNSHAHLEGELTTVPSVCSQVANKIVAHTYANSPSLKVFVATEGRTQANCVSHSNAALY